MAKKITLFKRSEPEPLEPDVNAALRSLAGWPAQQHQQSGSRSRHRTVVTHRDQFGRVIGSVEQLDEDEYEEYSDIWGK